MTAAAASWRAGWNRFWFTPQSTAPVELFRIVFGIVATLWILSLAPTLNAFFGANSAVASLPQPVGAWSVFTLFGGSSAIWVIWVVALLAGCALTVGYRTRAAAMIVFVMIASAMTTALTVFNSGDGLIRLLALYMMLMPAGSAVSVDRWLADRRGMWDFPIRAPWALRLVQIQLSVVYLCTVWEKSDGALWRNGTAVSVSMRVGDLMRIPAPSFVTDSVVISQLLTYGTVALELALGVLVWNRTARPVVLWLGVLLHVSIELSLAIGFFSIAMLTTYLAFVSPEAATRVMRWMRDRAIDVVSPSPDAGRSALTERIG